MVSGYPCLLKHEGTKITRLRAFVLSVVELEGGSDRLVTLPLHTQ